MNMTNKTEQGELVHPRIFGLHMEVEATKRYFEQNIMAIGFRESGIRFAIPDEGFSADEERVIRDGFSNRKGDARSLSTRLKSAGKLLSQMVYASCIRPGDVVVFANSSLFGKDVVLGVVIGEHWEYVADDDTYCHHRRVRWTHRVPREKLKVDSKDIIHYIAPRKTIAKMNVLFRDRILSIQSGMEYAIASE